MRCRPQPVNAGQTAIKADPLLMAPPGGLLPQAAMHVTHCTPACGGQRHSSLHRMAAPDACLPCVCRIPTSAAASMHSAGPPAACPPTSPRCVAATAWAPRP
jgi:hypothetical protein